MAAAKKHDTSNTNRHKASSNENEAKVKEEKQNKRHGKLWIILAIILAAVCICLYVFLVQFPIEEVENGEVSVEFSTEYIDDPEMEQGTEKIEEVGAEGKRTYIWKVKRKGLLTKTEVDRFLDRVEETKAPVKQVIRRGTRRWQYMTCSDGSYRYYNDEDFANGAGFTHASEDFCAKNGQGKMVELADTPPTRRATNAYTSPYRPYTSGYAPSNSTPSPDFTSNYESPALDQYSPSGSTDTNISSGSDKWCGMVGNNYVCK